MSIADSLRSDDVPRQLQALQLLVSREPVRPVDDCTLTAVIENGLSCEKSAAVRELSFVCIERLYAARAAWRWNEVRSAIVTELGTAEEAHALAAAIRVLKTLPIEEQMLFCASKDGASVIRSVCLNEVSIVRAAAVEQLGPVLLHIWCYLHAKPDAVESVYQTESTSQARRLKEDVWDMVGDLFKSFAGGILGSATGAEPTASLEDTPRCAAAYFSAIGLAYEYFYRSRSGDVLCRWVSALLAQTSSPLHTDLEQLTTHDNIHSGLSLLLLQITPILCNEPQLLFLRCRQLGFTAPCCSMVTFLFLSLLADTPHTARYDSIELTHEISTAMSFDAPVTAEDTSSSRSAKQSISIMQMVDEWTSNHLTTALQLASISSDIYTIAFCIIASSQHASLAQTRHKVAPVVVEHLFRALRSGNLPSQNIYPMILMAVRSLPRSSLAETLTYVLSFLQDHVSDDAALSKLMAEVSVLLMCDVSNHCAVAAPQALHAFLSSHVISAMFADSAKFSRVSPLRERLVTALCRCVVRLLPGCLAAACSGRSHSVGLAAEVTGSTLTSVEKGVFPSGVALESLVASALFIVRYTRKCFNWPIDGIAGEAAQLGLVELLGVLAQLLTPTRADKHLLPRHMSDTLKWASTAFADVVSDFLQLLRQPRLIPSSNARMQLLTLFGQYLETIFGPASYLTADRGLEVLDLIQADLMLTDVEKQFNVALMTRTVTGLLGGWINMNPPHPFVYAPIQVKALSALEVIAQHNSKLAESVLDILLEFDEKCITDARIKKLVSPSIQQKLILAIRRVLFCCPSSVNIAAKTKHLNLIIDETVAARQSYRRNSVDHAAFDPFCSSTSSATTSKPQIQTQRQLRSNSVAAVSAQESFKSIQRRASLGLSITATAHCAEPTATSAAAAVKDVLRQVCKPGYMEALDAEAEYGCFSDEGSGPGSGGANASARHVASADVVALVDDVLSYHLQPITSQQPDHEKETQKCMRGVLSFPGDASEWHALSGSSDVMTLHGRFVFCCDRNEVTYVVRIINSSGFKVPCFSVQLLLECADSSCRFLGNSCAEGVDYFLPGAVAERRFSLIVSAFADIHLKLRILLPDMVADHIDMFAGATAKPNGIAVESPPPAITYTARLECTPVPLPVTSFLVPYGCGSLSSMRRLANRRPLGVPPQVFQSLWDRLSAGSQVPVVGMISCTAMLNSSLSDLIQLACRDALSTKDYDALISSRSCFDRRGSSLGRRIMSTQAWCFHSWFGDEIAVKVSAAKVARQENSSTGSRKVFWSGTLELRASNANVLQLLLRYVPVVLRHLTGGALQMCDGSSSLLVLPRAAPEKDTSACCSCEELLCQSKEIQEQAIASRKRQRETLLRRLNGTEYAAADCANITTSLL